jgi:hypothetical protein
VLFDRICRKNGIEHLLTKVRSPTTTGKLERWHQTLQIECVEPHGPFAGLEDAQAVIDEFRREYNTRRPHQSLDMATPASRFRPVPERERALLGLWLRRGWSCSPPRRRNRRPRRRPTRQGTRVLVGVKVVRPRGAPP